MSTKPFQQLACPLDGEALLSDGASWRCSAGHTYDIARQGYTHLLPVQNMRSRNPGDSKEMVEARQRFLNAGFYEPIADAVACAVLEKSSEDAHAADIAVLDAGCGEGYYLRRLAASASENQPLEIIGLDISKPSVLSAAKQDKSATWIVGSNANLPVLPDTVDRVTCMFGFPTYSEFARILKAGGELLLVESGPDHLRELREIIYPVVKPDGPVTERVVDGFMHLSTESVRFGFDLTSADQISDLLSMTPHLFRASAEGRAKVAALDSLSLTADIRLMRFGVIKQISEITTAANIETADVENENSSDVTDSTTDIEIEVQATPGTQNTDQVEKAVSAFDWKARQPVKK